MVNESEQLRGFLQEGEVIVDEELIASLWQEFDSIIEAKGKNMSLTKMKIKKSIQS